MTHRNDGETRVLAIDRTTRGFGFAAFEGPERLIDWGVVGVRSDKQVAILRRVREEMHLIGWILNLKRLAKLVPVPSAA